LFPQKAQSWKNLKRWALVVVAGLILFMPSGLSAQSLKLERGTLIEDRAEPKEIQVTIGKTKVLDTKETVQRVSVTDPKIADLVVISVHQVLINGKRVGITSFLVWHEDGTRNVFSLWVTPNVEQVRKRLDDMMPGHRIDVEVDRDKLVVMGEVGDLESMERALAIVRPHAPEVVNFLRVRAPQQVQLKVRIAVVSRPALREAGISFSASRETQDFGGVHAPGSNVVELNTGLSSGAIPPGPLFAPISPAFALTTQLVDLALNKQASMAVFLSLLESEGFAKTLAEPTLVAMSGQTASFLSGGEFPVPIVSDDDVSIVFKKFGVRLGFTPTVLGDETIWLKVAPEVSEVSFDLGTTTGFLTIPGILAQKAETTVKLKDGQTFVIAGLLQDKIDSQVQKIPILGDIPILGALFRQVRHSRTETELLITVTPRLVKPLGPEQIIPMPGDEAVYDPDDFELFLLGKMTHAKVGKTKEQKALKEYTTSQAGPGGYIGFIK
jgi:pilus assembly protein CpaC